MPRKTDIVIDNQGLSQQEFLLLTAPTPTPAPYQATAGSLNKVETVDKSAPAVDKEGDYSKVVKTKSGARSCCAITPPLTSKSRLHSRPPVQTYSPEYVPLRAHRCTPTCPRAAARPMGGLAAGLARGGAMAALGGGAVPALKKVETVDKSGPAVAADLKVDLTKKTVRCVV